MPVDRNPYTPGRPVGTQAMFFGRQAELLTIHARLVDGIHTAVVGPAEIGVSSLLRRVAASPEADGRLVAYVDLSDTAAQTPERFAQALWNQWSEKVRTEDTAGLSGLVELDALAHRLVGQGHKLVAILDEYEQLLWRPAQFDALFHALLEALAREGIVTLVTGTHTPLAELHQKADNPSTLYELTVQRDVGLLDPADAMALLATPVGRAGFTLPVTEAEYFVDLAGAHPLFLQLAGYYLFTSLDANRYNRDQVTTQFKAAAKPYWQEMWQGLPPPARADLSAKGLAEGASFSRRQVRTLGRKGMVLDNGAGARLFSRGFADWARTMQQASQLAREASADSRSAQRTSQP